MSITLHYAPRTRAFTALWLVEELGEPYELASFDINTGAHKRPEFLALNRMGKIPVVEVDGIPVVETGAITIYLADRFAPGRLAPTLEDAQRPAFLRWILFAAAVMEPAFGEKFFKWTVPARSVAWGSFADMEATLSEAVAAGEWLLGDRFSAADVYVGATARFGVMFGAFAKTGPIADYVARLTARPGFERAAAIEARESARFPQPK